MGDKESEESLPSGKRVEIRVRKNGKKEKVIVERVEAEGLPPGWIKEIKEKKVGNKVRRDPFYIDPVSHYVFRSMKDSLRYVETGEIGRLAFKPKEKSGHEDDDDLEDDEEDSSHAIMKKQKVEETGTEAQIMSQSTKMSKITKDGDVLDLTCKGEGRSLSEVISDQYGMGNTLSCSNLAEPRNSDKSDGLKDCAEDVSLSTPKQSLDCGEKKLEETPKTKSKKGRSKKNKEVLNLPRRSSQRLAARGLEQKHQLEDNNEVVGNKVEEPLDLAKSKDPVNSITGNKNENDKQEETPGDLPIGDLLSDPCIAFAIKTLTGEVTFDTPNASEVSSLGSNKEIEGNLKQENIVIAENSYKTGEKSELPVELPSEDIWQDPCIEFAIKTLTGVIDPDIQDCFQQQEIKTSSSQTQARTDFSSQSKNANNDGGNSSMQNISGGPVNLSVSTWRKGMP